MPLWKTILSPLKEEALHHSPSGGFASTLYLCFSSFCMEYSRAHSVAVVVSFSKHFLSA